MKTTPEIKILLVLGLFLLGSSARAQNIASVPAAKAACGPEDIKFEVRLDDSQQPKSGPENGKAVVYILQDFPRVGRPFELTTRTGVDGAWVGANLARSFFSFMIDPGVHHVCVSGQWSVLTSPSSIALHSVVAKAGESYYFRVRLLDRGNGGINLGLEPVDEDEATFLQQTSPRSTSHPK